MNKLSKTLCMLLIMFIVVSLTACGGSNTAGNGNSNSADNGKSTDGGNSAAPEKSDDAAKKERPKIKVVLMTGDDTRKAINAKYLTEEKFKADLPDIDVEIEEVVGGDDYTNKLKTYNSTGELPDVFFSTGTMMLKPMINSGTVQDLLPIINKDGFAAKYKEKAAITPYTDGKLYVLQAGSDMYSTPKIFYNKEIFEKYDIEVPKTFDEFMDVAQTLKSKGIVPWATYGLDGWAVKNYLFQNLVMAQDPQVINDLIAGKTDFSNPVSMDALTKIQQMVKAGVFQPGVLTMEYGAVKELFTSGKAAMYTMMTWELPSLAEDPKVDYMDFPQINPSVDMSTTLQYWGGPNSGYAVNSKSKYLEAAVKVAEYCATQEAKFFNIEQNAPTAIDTGVALKAGSALMQKNLDQFAAAKNKVPTLSLYAFGSKFDPEFGSNAERLLTGKYSPDEFVKALSELWKDNFK